MTSFHFCETCLLHIKPFVVNKRRFFHSWAVPFFPANMFLTCQTSPRVLQGLGMVASSRVECCACSPSLSVSLSLARLLTRSNTRAHTRTHSLDTHSRILFLCTHTLPLSLFLAAVGVHSLLLRLILSHSCTFFTTRAHAALSPLVLSLPISLALSRALSVSRSLSLYLSPSLRSMHAVHRCFSLFFARLLLLSLPPSLHLSPSLPCSLPHSLFSSLSPLQNTATHRSTLQQSAAPIYVATVAQCNTLHHTAPHCLVLKHIAKHCKTLQNTATHCNTLQIRRCHGPRFKEINYVMALGTSTLD